MTIVITIHLTVLDMKFGLDTLNSWWHPHLSAVLLHQ